MLANINRIDRHLFKELSKNSRVFYGDNLIIRCKIMGRGSSKGTLKAARIAVVVSKKVAPRAVTRNQIKRRVYSAVRDSITLLNPGLIMAVYPKKSAINLPYVSLKKELNTLFCRISDI